MERVCELLFELSSIERMSILLEVQKQSLKMSQVSKALSMTTTESFRHLQRLSEAKLVQKDTEGAYGLTPFGALALTQLSGLNFVSENRQYFMEHAVSHLPYEFISRIGELSSCSLVSNDIMTGFVSLRSCFRRHANTSGSYRNKSS